jgi:hypothetical protein
MQTNREGLNLNLAVSRAPALAVFGPHRLGSKLGRQPHPRTGLSIIDQAPADGIPL